MVALLAEFRPPNLVGEFCTWIAVLHVSKVVSTIDVNRSKYPRLQCPLNYASIQRAAIVCHCLPRCTAVLTKYIVK